MKDVRRATAAIISDPEGRILLVQHASGQRRWGLPGARLGPAELPVEAIVREVRRETGLETRVVDLLGLYHLSGGLDGDEEELPDVLTYAFRCEMITDEAVLNGRGRICDLGWYTPVDVPNPVTVTAHAALDDCGAGRAGVVRDLAR
ncbi:MAG TPA: NUDIX hydrolase [Mycobacteriales bacterium]|nr:NUDIX hydrolase [Mycobacteriales bacterium]